MMWSTMTDTKSSSAIREVLICSTPDPDTGNPGPDPDNPDSDKELDSMKFSRFLISSMD